MHVPQPLELLLGLFTDRRHDLGEHLVVQIQSEATREVEECGVPLTLFGHVCHQPFRNAEGELGQDHGPAVVDVHRELLLVVQHDHVAEG